MPGGKALSMVRPIDTFPLQTVEPMSFVYLSRGGSSRRRVVLFVSRVAAVFSVQAGCKSLIFIDGAPMTSLTD